MSIWSADFVKWWALYKAQEISSKVLAVHLRGTVFINYWFEMLGENITSSPILDTVDITDPSLVSIGEQAVINEGVLLQSHEVKNGVLSFNPIRIGQKSSIGPYAVVQRGSIVEDGTHVLALNTSKTAVNVKATSTKKVSRIRNKETFINLVARTLEKSFRLTHFLFSIMITGQIDTKEHEGESWKS